MPSLRFRAADVLFEFFEEEEYRPMEVEFIDTLKLTTMDADPQTESDSLRLVLDIKVPEDFLLMEDVRYAVSFGNYLVTSDQFDSLSKSDNELLFSMGSGKSTLQMAFFSDQKQLKISLNLSEVQLYQDILQYVLNSRDNESSSNISTVYMPIKPIAGDYQTGEVWMDFEFEVKDGFSEGSNPRLNSSESSSPSDSDDDDNSCFISTLN